MSGALDPFLAHEALDRAASAATIWQNLILDHEFIRQNPDLARQAEAIAKAIGALYQAIGERQAG